MAEEGIAATTAEELFKGQYGQLLLGAALAYEGPRGEEFLDLLDRQLENGRAQVRADSLDADEEDWFDADEEDWAADE